MQNIATRFHFTFYFLSSCLQTSILITTLESRWSFSKENTGGSVSAEKTFPKTTGKIIWKYTWNTIEWIINQTKLVNKVVVWFFSPPVKPHSDNKLKYNCIIDINETIPQREVFSTVIRFLPQKSRWYKWWNCIRPICLRLRGQLAGIRSC